jgi:outer membrane protein insertion porin family
VGSENDILNEVRRGGQLTLTRPLSDTRRIVLGLSSEDIHLNLSAADQNNTNLPDFVRQEGRISTLSVRGIRDTRDILTDPAKGVYYTASVDLGNADVKPNVKGSFTKGSLDLRRYYSRGVRKSPTQKKTVWAGRLLLGTMGGEIPFSEQFFVGGAETLRGYLESRFWGRHMFLANLEYRKPFASAFQGVLFLDMGDAWGSSYQLPTTVDPSGRFQQHSSPSPKFGTGVGVRVTTPIGPLRLDWGFGSEGSRAHFSIGHVF